jgi:hypothetical protein
LISPKIYQLLQLDPTIRTVTICDLDEAPDVYSSWFKAFLDCLHLGESLDLSASDELTFLSICRVLGNERLAFLFLASLNSLSLSPSNSTTGSTSAPPSSNQGRISSDVLVNLISSSEATIDYCASQFHRYSVDEIGRLDTHTLHLLLSSRSLRLESEDQFLRFLMDLGSDYFEF